nr:reverse transcriptase domain-containing protein [Tanacetum cinerariifolium]
MEADDQSIQTIRLGLPEDIYAAVDSCESAQEIWLTSSDEESIESYYHRFSKLMNDFKRNKHFSEKIASNLKFLNNLQPEWSRHITIVHQTKDLHTADYTQLYDFLKYNQKEVDEPRAERLRKTQDPLTLMANSNNPFNYPVFHQDQHQVVQNAVQNPGVQNVRNQNGLIVVLGIANQNSNEDGNVIAARAEGNAIGNNDNHVRCYNWKGLGHLARNCTVRPRRKDAAYLQTQLLIAQKEEAGIQIQAEEFDLMDDAVDLDEIEEVNANYILMANLQQASTSEEQYTKLLEPIPEPHQVPYNDSNVISEVFSVKQGGGTVEKPSANVEETHAYHESLFHNLAVEVEKINSVNRKMKETNAELTTELARYKNKVKCFEIRQEKYEKLERVQNFEIQFLKEAAKFVRHFTSLAKEADESIAKQQTLELEIEYLLKAVVSQDITSIVLNPLVAKTFDLQTELERVDNTAKTKRLQPKSNTKNDRVAFRRNTCFVRNLKGVELLKGNCTTNLYTINLHEMAFASLICLMARATSTKSWLWHQRLSHLNFDTINDLAKNDLVTGLLKFKYHKERLCPSCEQEKGKRASHPHKPGPNSKQRLHLFHMDLCGPMRIASKNGKRTPQQNGVVEQRNRTLVEAARTMLIFSRAPLFLWAEAIANAYEGSRFERTKLIQIFIKAEVTFTSSSNPRKFTSTMAPSVGPGIPIYPKKKIEKGTVDSQPIEEGTRGIEARDVGKETHRGPTEPVLQIHKTSSPSSAFIIENINVLRTMIKEHDQQAKRKATPKRLAYADSDKEASIGSLAMSFFYWFSLESSRMSDTRIQTRSADKSQRTPSKNKVPSHRRRLRRLEDWSRTKEKVGRSKSRGKRSGHQETSSDSEYEEGSEDTYEDLNSPYKGHKPTPFTQRITRFKYHQREKLFGNIRGVLPVLCISAFMHSHGHAKLVKKLNDKIPKTVEEMLERFKAFIGGEVIAGSAEMVHPPQWDKENVRPAWSGGSKKGKNIGERSGLTDELTFLAIPQNRLADEPIILEGMIKDHQIRRILVDSGSSSEIMYEHCFRNLSVNIGLRLRRCRAPLIGFSGETYHPLGIIDLRVTMGEAERNKTVLMEFVIINAVRRTTLGEVGSTIHSMIKFPTNQGIVTLETSREALWECSSWKRCKVHRKRLSRREGRVPKWSAEIWPCDISYIQKEEAKGSVVNKFFGKGEQVQETPDARIILVSLDEKMHSYTIRLNFNASDHAMDCEALLVGLIASVSKEFVGRVGTGFDD